MSQGTKENFGDYDLWTFEQLIQGAERHDFQARRELGKRLSVMASVEKEQKSGLSYHPQGEMGLSALWFVFGAAVSSLIWIAVRI